MTVGERRLRVADLAFIIGFGVFVLGGLFVLAQGLLAVVASASPDLHEYLHVQGLGSGPWARVALRAADACHSVPSAPQIIAVRVPSDVNDVEEYLLSGIEPSMIRWLDIE